MTKPNLDEKRDAQFRHYRERQHPGKECPMCSDLYHGWNAGWNAALATLRDVPGEFDFSDFGEEPSIGTTRAIELSERDIWEGQREAAHWQFSRDKERIALAEARIAELESALELGMKRIKKMNHEIETCRLQYPECGMSPSTVFAEMDLNKMRQALKEST